MTDEQKQISENNRENKTKSSLNQLYAIYNQYNDDKINNCWCSRAQREEKHTQYYEWFEKYNN